MRILIFLFLVSSCSFYYSNAAGNTDRIKIISADNPRPGDAVARNKRDISVGGETEQDPNDPKYQKMAEKLVYDNLRIRKEDIRNIKLIRVTVQVVSGIVTRMEIQITLVSGISYRCNFKVWEQPWANVKHVTYNCLAPGNQKLLSANSGIPRPEQIRDPKDPKYQKLAAASIDYWFKTPEYKPFGKEGVDKIYVTNVKAQIGSNIKSHIHFIVIVNGTNFKCTSNVTETPWNPEKIENVSEVACLLADEQGKTQMVQDFKNPIGSLLKLKKNQIPGGETYEKPWKPIYKEMANRAFQKYQLIHNSKIKVKDTVVDTVTSQVVAGKILRINFHVFTVNGPSYMCKSKLFKAPGVVDFDIKVDCSKIGPGYEKEQDPNDPQYKILAERSFEWYQKQHKQVDVKSINVLRVTTQVVAGTATRINFLVYPTEGNTYECNSKIFESVGRDHTIKYNVNCTNKYPGGEVVQDPNDPKYHKLAELSFEWYQVRYKNLKIRVESIKVNRVTTQVVAGTITRIYFDVNPTRGSQLKCYSKIFERVGPDPNPDFDVICNSIYGGEEVQDPDDPKYQDLAKESFKWYQNKYKNVTVRVKRIKVNRVTTQVVSGLITRIVFRVYPTIGSQYTCQSKIFEKPGPHSNRDFDVNCNSILGGEEEQDPDDPKYHKLAELSFQWYQFWHKNLKIRVKSIKVNRVTTQVVAGIITRIYFGVHPTRGSQLTCYSKIFKGLDLHPNPDFDVICNNLIGGEEEQDPYDPKYQELAKESFEWYQKTHKNVKVIVKRIEVNQVTTQVVAGLITRIDLRVYPTRGRQLTCHSKIFKGPGPHSKPDFDVDCNFVLGGEEEQDPDDPKYKALAKQSFEWYLNSHPELRVHVKSIEVNDVTTQVVSGIITRMNFRVHPTRGSMFMCTSKITEKPAHDKNIIMDVKCTTIVGGEVEEDPNDPQYIKLAQESFEWYQKSHGNIGYAKRIDIDSVTSQLVAGTIIRIYFRVTPSRGGKLDCFSKIYKSMELHPKFDFNVSCAGYDGGEEEQDPAKPRFLQLAKESFRKYLESHPDELIAIRNMQVTRATTQVVAGIITRLDFYVITTESVKYTCHSDVFEKVWENIKTITVDCNHQPLTGGNKKLSLNLSPTSNTEDFVSNAIKEYLRNKDHSGLQVDRCETMSVSLVRTRVAKQRITYYQVDAFTHTVSGDYAIFNCSVLTGAWFGKKPFSTNCYKKIFLLGRSEWSDPVDIKYLSYAEKSLQLYLKNSSENVGPRDYTKYDVIVTFVTKGLAAGYVYDINFFARWVHDRDDDPGVLLCKSKLWEKLNEIYEIVHVKCTHVSWDRNNW